MASVAAVVGAGSAFVAGAFFVARYPRHPRLSAGKYPVGACLTRFDGCPACQIFYPAKPGGRSSTSDAGAWFRPKLLNRILEDYLKGYPVPSFLLKFLACRPPHEQDAPVEAKAGKFPVVIFSHGLLGSLDMYKTLCGGLAASGFIVIALEHEDGSALFAETADGLPVARRAPPPQMEYTRDNVGEFRAPFLAKRIEEIRRTISALKQKSTPNINSGLVEAILMQTDVTRLYCVGHSFGSTTCALALHELHSMSFKGCALLDLWPLPLPRKVDAGLNACPILFLTSESFSNFKEFKITRRLAENSKAVLGPFVVSGAAHQSFSDTACVLPHWLGRRIYLCGRGDVDHVYQAILDSVRIFLHACDDPDELAASQRIENALSRSPLISKL